MYGLMPDRDKGTAIKHKIDNKNPASVREQSPR